MLPFVVAKRLIIVLLILLSTGFTTGLVYNDYATKWSFSSFDQEAEARDFTKKCQEDRDPQLCSLAKSYLETARGFKEEANKDKAIGFWWFLMAWCSTGLLVGYFVLSWIMTGRAFKPSGMASAKSLR